MKIRIVDAHNNTTIDSKDLMKIFKERQLAVKISSRGEYDTFIEMAKEAGFDIPEGLCFEDIKKRPCLHLSQVFENKLFCDFVEYCEAPESPYSFRFDMRPYKVVSYDEFIHMGCEPERVFVAGGRGNGKGMRTLKIFLDELDKEEKKLEPLRCEPEVVTPDKFSAFTSAPVKKPSLDFGKLLHQRLVDFNMTDPYDIHISSDGKTTTARFYVNGKVVRRAEANCHPDDRFNFKTGAEVAFDRLFEKQHKEKKEKVDLNNLKPGDKVRVRRDLEACREYGGVMVNNKMQDFAGQVVRIYRVTPTTQFAGVVSGITVELVEDYESWSWTPEMFEEV